MQFFRGAEFFFFEPAQFVESGGRNTPFDDRGRCVGTQKPGKADDFMRQIDERIFISNEVNRMSAMRQPACDILGPAPRVEARLAPQGVTALFDIGVNPFVSAARRQFPIQGRVVQRRLQNIERMPVDINNLVVSAEMGKQEVDACVGFLVNIAPSRRQFRGAA